MKIGGDGKFRVNLGETTDVLEKIKEILLAQGIRFCVRRKAGRSKSLEKKEDNHVKCDEHTERCLRDHPEAVKICTRLDEFLGRSVFFEYPHGVRPRHTEFKINRGSTVPRNKELALCIKGKGRYVIRMGALSFEQERAVAKLLYEEFGIEEKKEKKVARPQEAPEQKKEETTSEPVTPQDVSHPIPVNPENIALAIADMLKAKILAEGPVTDLRKKVMEYLAYPPSSAGEVIKAIRVLEAPPPHLSFEVGLKKESKRVWVLAKREDQQEPASPPSILEDQQGPLRVEEDRRRIEEREEPKESTKKSDSVDAEFVLGILSEATELSFREILWIREGVRSDSTLRELIALLSG